MASYPRITAAEAAALVQHGQTVGFSGFTSAGTAKSIALALADRARAEHTAGRPYQIGVITGASAGKSLDGALAKADAMLFRTPFQADPDLRKGINEGRIRYFDMHLSLLQPAVRTGALGPLHWAVVEASDVQPDGGIVLTSSVGASNTFLRQADRVLIELNRQHPPELLGLHDLYEPAEPPFRREIPIYAAHDRIGSPVAAVDPRKIVGLVESQLDDEVAPFRGTDEITRQIGEHVADFLAGEVRMRRVPQTFLPIQSGVGNVANAVLGALGAHPQIPPFAMYTEVVQDAVVDLLREGRISFASTCALTFAPETLTEVYRDLAFFRDRLLLRPQEITNSPEVIRRLGLISLNTAIEVDIFGNANSTHVMGSQLMNGIGGSGDFTRNAHLSFLVTPSVAKDGRISAIVPCVTHLDHSEHSLQVVVTEQGVADLRGLAPRDRAELIIKNCAHPDYRDDLREYLRLTDRGHVPQALRSAFAMHEHYLESGTMRGVPWGKVLVGRD